MHRSCTPLTQLPANFPRRGRRALSNRRSRARKGGLRCGLGHFLLGLLQAVFLTAALPLTAQAATEAERFAELEALPWSTVLEYEGGPLGEDWWVEGDPEAVVGQEDRLLFKTGDAPQPTGLPAVLWAEPVIEGDVRVDFIFTRLWDQDQGGNTLFLLASGLGTESAPVDLKETAGERADAALPHYRDRTSAIALDFSAFTPTREAAADELLRAAVYPARLSGRGPWLSSTRVEPRRFGVGLAERGESVRVTLIKRGNELFARFLPEGEAAARYAHWDLSEKPPVMAGRIGFRQDAGRWSGYDDIRIQELPPEARIGLDWRELETAADFAEAFPGRAARLLAAVDADYPGLKAFREAMAAGESVRALEALLDYYRDKEERAAWAAPNLPLEALETLPDERQARVLEIADAALEDRFFFGGSFRQAKRIAHDRLDWRQSDDQVGTQWATRANRHYFFEELVMADRLTDDPAYVEQLDSLLRDWLVHEPSAELPRANEPGWAWINAGIRLRDAWPLAFFAFQEAEAFRPATRLLFLWSILDHMDFLQRKQTEGDNWATMELAGQVAGGTFFPEFKEAEAWYAEGMARLGDEIDYLFYPDGTEVEMSAVYHVVAMRNLESALGVAQAAGRVAPEPILASFENMYDYLARVMTPIGTLPQNGDSDWKLFRDYLLEGATAFDRPDWRYVATNGTEGTPPMDGPSYFLPWGGHLVSRSGYRADAQWSFFDVGPWGTNHQHADKLHLSIVDGGIQQLVDAGRFAYFGEVADKFFKAYQIHTRGHNTVLVDGLSQRIERERTLIPSAWGSTRADFDFAMADFMAGYLPEPYAWMGPAFEPYLGWLPVPKAEDVRHRRAVLYLRDRGWLVLDRVQSTEPRTLETLWHLAPETEVTVDEAGVALTDRDAGPDLRIRPIEGPSWDARVVEGQDEPHPQGWYAVQNAQFTTAPCVIYESDVDAGEHVAAWWIRSGSAIDEPVTIEPLDAPEGTRCYAITFADGDAVEVAISLDGTTPVALSDGSELHGLAAVRNGVGTDVAVGRIADVAGRTVADDPVEHVDGALRDWAAGQWFASTESGERIEAITLEDPVWLGDHTLRLTLFENEKVAVTQSLSAGSHPVTLELPEGEGSFELEVELVEEDVSVRLPVYP